MKIIMPFISFWLLLSLCFCNSQKNKSSYEEDLIEIFQVYKNVNAPNKDLEAIAQKMGGIQTAELKFTAEFVNEWVQPKHDIVSNKFLKKPDQASLKAVYLIRHLSWNSMTTDFKPKLLMAQIDFNTVTNEELLNAYYGILFNKILTQFQSKNYANVNFNLDDLNLQTPEDQAIFYYNSVYAFGTKYMMQGRSKTKPCERANNYLKMMPKYEGKLFAEYEVSPFQDFKVNIANNKRETSFTKHFTGSYNNAMATYRKCNE